jgi:hypothetical protein
MYPEIFAGGFKVAIALLAFLSFVGYGPARLMLSGPWAPYRLVSAPVVGWIMVVPISYLLNANLLGMIPIFWILVGVGGVGNVVAFRWRGRIAAVPQDRLVLLAAGLGLGLFLVALIPHANDSSLALLALNVDEELYWPYAEHLKYFPATMEGAAHSPFGDLFVADDFRSRGQGFVYLLSLASIVSATPTILAYMPLVYTLLALSVVSTYLFARVGLNLGGRTSLLAAGLYAANGLPLWFSGMGFGPHMVAFALLPLALAALTVALNHGRTGPILFAGLVGAVLLISYFWAISAVFLVSATFLTFGLVAFQPHRMLRIRRLFALTIVAIAAGSVGFFWLLRWSLPRLTSVASDLDASFGNAWGDLSFPPFQLAPGIQTYHMVFDRSGIMAAIPNPLWEILNALAQPVWIAVLFLAGIALLRMSGNRLAATMLAVGFALFMFWVLRIAAYQYGHFKNLSYVSFFVDTLIAAGLATLWVGGRKRFAGLVPSATWRRWSNVVLRSAAALTLVALLTLSLRNSLHTFRWYWLGFSWNLPHSVVDDVQRVADLIPEGATVAVSPDAEYPLARESIKFRPITLAFHYENNAVERWSGRLWALLATELPSRDVFLPAGTTAFATNPELIPENPDFLVLGRDEDPRLHGLVPAENLTPGAVVGLYRGPGANVLSGEELIVAAGGRGPLVPGRPLTIRIASDGLFPGSLDTVPTDPSVLRQVLLGVANVSTSPVAVQVASGGAATTLLLDSGLNWIITDSIAVGSTFTLGSTEASSIIPMVARSLEPLLGVPSGVTADSRAIVWVQAVSLGDTIEARLTFIQPDHKGRNVGVSYREDTTRGYWVSAVTLPASIHQIELEYYVSERRLNETLDGTYKKTGVAREAPEDGVRKFDLVFAHGDETDRRITLFEYQFLEQTASIIRTPSIPYVFTLRDR